MGATTAAAGSRAVGAATIAEVFRITAEDHPDRVAVRTKDDEVTLTWSELRDRVDALARGLHELGVRRGDTIALLLGNRPEFHIADLAAMTLGAIPFSTMERAGFVGFALVMALFVIGFTNDLGRLMGEGFNLPR